MKNLPQAFTQRMKDLLGDEYIKFISEYENEPIKGLRVNTLKLSASDFAQICPWKLTPSKTLDEGFILDEAVEHIGTTPYHIAGLFYMQEPSAMSVIKHADIKPGMKVLDMCAAPGGKSGGIAARLNGSGFLISNEIVASRAKQLLQNLERLGVTNAVVTNAHPDVIPNVLKGYFDRVIVDAPCSGEGMFRKDPNAVSEWSIEHVRSCSYRQSAILESSSKTVAPGGKLIYSTCTFSREENEDVIERFLCGNPNFTLESMSRYYPHTCLGEGHFVAVLLCKDNEQSYSCNEFKPAIGKNEKQLVTEFFKSTFDSVPKNGNFHSLSGKILFLPDGLPEEIKRFGVINAGVSVGNIAKSNFKPAHSLFMAENECSDFKIRCKNSIKFDTNSEELKTFLSGNVIEIPESLSGYVSVRIGDYPIGFGKAVNGILKNHLPKGLVLPFYR